MAYNYDNIIEIELSQKLRDIKIVEDFTFDTVTRDFVLELNHGYDNLKAISPYDKRWDTTRRKFKSILKEKHVKDEHIELLLDTLDKNYHAITLNQENYDKYDHAENGDKVKRDNEKYKNDDDNKTTFIVNKYSQEIPLAESVLIDNVPYFIQLDNNDGKKKPVLSKQISLADIDLVPPERTEYLTKEYNFQSIDEINRFIELAKKETLDSLFKKVKSILKKYLDLDEDFINILAADIIFTYFQDRLGMTHYLLIVGDNNTGKSNILLIFSFLGYRAIYDTAITPANIYNFGSQLEEGQCIIIEDEIDDIDDQIEKKKLYKVSYRSGVKVTRMYDSNNNFNLGKHKRKSSRQQSFFLFCFKMFASETMPDKKKSKGFLERLIPLKSIPGDPEYDIAEVVDDAGDEKFKELYQELLDTRKLLLIYRLLHNNDPIPDIKLNIKNRYKQLTKPVIRLFQNTQAVNDIIKSLSRYLIEKNEEKIDSFDSALLFLIIDLVSKYDTTLYNDQIWQEVINKFPGGTIEGQPYSYYIEGYGKISKTKITNICEEKFGAKQHKDKEKGRGLVFSQEKLNKLAGNYSIIKGIEIISQEEKYSSSRKSNGDTCDTDDTFTDNQDKNNKDRITKNDNNMTDMALKNESSIPQKDNLKTKIDVDIDTRNATHSQKVSQVSPLSPSLSISSTSLTDNSNKSKQSIDELEELKSLISSSLYDDVLYAIKVEPQKRDTIIYNAKNIERTNPYSDKCLCSLCGYRDDKWGVFRHLCKNFQKQKKSS